MNKSEMESVLLSVAKGKISVQEAEVKLRNMPFEDLGYAKPDYHRGIRQGVPEVIYGSGKTKEQIEGIAKALMEKGQESVLITRLDGEKGKYIKERLSAEYYETAKICIAGKKTEERKGNIVIATGGTSDMAVAEEAAVTCEFLGNNVTRLYDVGVAGIHRLLAHSEEIMKARVIIAIAGMEGALASVIGGLADCPVIAVPTSVGYGAAFGGVAALLSMLNSCASGVSVVNIDNGFGAGYIASMINKME